MRTELNDFDVQCVFASKCREDDGAASVEYAILIAVIAGVVLAMVSEYDLSTVFPAVAAKAKEIVALAISQ